MLNKKVESLCNRQVEREGYSSNLYLSMASWAENSGLPGIASWLYAQAEEERVHFLKFIKYINERGGTTVIPSFEKPPSEFNGVEELFKKVLQHEEFVTGSINEIVHLTLEEKDYNTHNFLQWFVTEQVEEEASVRTILDKLHLTDPSNLYLFDRDILSLRSPSAGTAGT
jgi:ferritin